MNLGGHKHSVHNRDSRTCQAFVVLIQLLSHVQFFVTPWVAARQSPLSSTVSQSLLRFMSIDPVTLSNRSSSPPTSPFGFNRSQH